MSDIPIITQLLYVVAIGFFIMSLKGMSEVRSSRQGNYFGVAGMATAIVATLFAYSIQRVDLLLAAVVIGVVVGSPIALKVPMTAIPQRTAMSHAFGSLAVALVGTAEFYQRGPNIDHYTVIILSAEMILGYLTFTGSCIAFCKLQGIIPGKPLIYPGRTILSLSSLGIAIGLGIYMALFPNQEYILPIMAVFALLFGFLLVVAIGGADMPTVIAILNSYAGLSAAALGFVLDNRVLIVAGALDGSSGLVLGLIMSKAMNRSFRNVLFGGVGATAVVSEKASQGSRSVCGYTVEDVATVLENARSVVVVPGYGLEVAQAQHVVKELADILQDKEISVKYGIHPVARRMPGHMNVLLAEAQVPYDQLWEMDRINWLFPETDVAIVVGANDVTNPAARTRSDSPLFGMPILNVDKAKTVVFIKRSTAPGFSGVDNELFYLPNTMMVFGDAKNVLADMVAVMSKS